MTTEDGDDLAGLIPELDDLNTPAPCHAVHDKCFACTNSVRIAPFAANNLQTASSVASSTLRL